MQVGRAWARLLTDIKAQMARDCVKLRWLKEQYLYLYYLDEACRGPLAADAIEVDINHDEHAGNRYN